MSTYLAGKVAGESLCRVGQRAVRELGAADYEEVLALLTRDPVRNVHLQSMIEDRGLCHPSHRGRFFGYYQGGKLAGVGLLGHAILICAELPALRYFALEAAAGAEGHVIFGPRAQVESFWRYFSQHGRETKAVREHHWYVCRHPRLRPNCLQLQQASPAELDMIAQAHAELAHEGSGTDPRVPSAESFRHRVAERIERGRIWVKIVDERVVFKADLASETAETAYLEGIWTHPHYRHRGIAKTCLSELTHRLLRQKKAVCLVAESRQQAALKLYERVGFAHCANYQARFLKPIQPQV